MLARRIMMTQQWASTAALVGRRCNVYGIQAAQNMRAANLMSANAARVFSSPNGVGIADAPDVFKVNYTEEFDQGLTDE